MKKILILIILCSLVSLNAAAQTKESYMSALGEMLVEDGFNVSERTKDRIVFSHNGAEFVLTAIENPKISALGRVYKPGAISSAAMVETAKKTKDTYSGVSCNLVDDNRSVIFLVGQETDFSLHDAENAMTFVYDNIKSESDLMSAYDYFVREYTSARKQQSQQPSQPIAKSSYLRVDGESASVTSYVPCEGGDTKYKVETSKGCNVKQLPSETTWICGSNKTFVSGDVYELKVNYRKNPYTFKRTASFVVYNGQHEVTVNVSQSGCPEQNNVSTDVTPIKKRHYLHAYEDYFWYIKFGPAANYWRFYNSDGNEDSNFKNYSVPQIGYNLVFGFEDQIAGPLFWGLNFGLSSNGFRLDYSKDGNKDVENLLSHNCQITPYLGLSARFSRGFAAEIYFGPYCGYDYFGAGKNVWEDNNNEYTYSYKIWNDEDHYWHDGGYHHFHYGLNFSFGLWFGSGFNLDFTVQNGLSDVVKQSNDAYARNFNVMARIGFRI